MPTMAEQLYDDYNDYRRQTGYIQKLKLSGRYVPAISRKRLSDFEALANWCSSKGVDPRLWLASLFESRRWLFPPKLNQLQSTNHLPRYEKLAGVRAFSDRIRQEHQTAAVAAGKVFDSGRDLSNNAELLKRRYWLRQDSARCMADMGRETYGYHPKSEICCQCGARFQCASILQQLAGYDIMSVRLGLITIEAARLAARHGRGI